MKLIIQIPCYNEEKTLPLTLKDLPNKINGIEKIETLVINDGSEDKTAEIARGLAVNYILNLPKRSGLAAAFSRGLEKSLELGADIIVNTDADNQYNGADIAKLVEPILNKKSDIVVGCRDINKIKHFSFLKRLLQKFGSKMVRSFSGTDIPDTTSGFRAYSREAALKIKVFSSYTYTLETIIQAGRQGIPITYVNINTNPKTRESRLISSIPAYIIKSAVTILRIYLMYEPLKTFLKISALPILAGLVLVGRFFILYFTQGYSGHIQSLIIAAILLITGFGIITIGLLGDIISANRKINEEILYRLKKLNKT